MSETTETETSTPSFLAGGNRRRFLAGVGVAGAALAFAACSDDDGDESTGGGDTTEGGEETTTTAGEDTTTTAGEDTTTTAGPGGGEVDETAIAMLAAGLEVLAVDTYTAAADAATAGDLGEEVPPAVVEYVTTALAHHEQHLASWNAVLTGGGNEEVTEPNADLKPTVDEAFGQVTDVTGAAKLALMLEQIAAQTYLDAASQLTTPEAIELASSIYIIDMQHSALLLFATGEYPVPDVFGKTEMSAAK